MLRLGANDLDDDKVRILTTIIRGVVMQATVWEHQTKPSHGAYFESGGLTGERVRKGDLVVCQTSGHHPWTVAFVHEVQHNPQSGTSCMLREIGSDKLCNVGNDSFYVVRGLREEDLWEGQKYIFAKQLSKVFSKHGDYYRKFSHIEFIDDEFANVFIRESFGGSRKNPSSGEWEISEPFSLKIKWNRAKVSLKTLYAEMEAEGYLTKEFHYIPDPSRSKDSTVVKMTIGPNFVTTVTEGPPTKEASPPPW